MHSRELVLEESLHMFITTTADETLVYIKWQMFLCFCDTSYSYTCQSWPFNINITWNVSYGSVADVFTLHQQRTIVPGEHSQHSDYLWLDGRGVGVRVPEGVSIFSPLHPLNRFWGHPASYALRARGYLPRGKAARAWSWPLTNN
jgi:hypothetical protein